MKSPKTLLIVLLTLTSLGGAGLAWRQYLELVELRAAAMNRDERADLQKRLWDLEKANRELQDRLAAARGGSDLESMLAEVTEERSGERGERGRGGRGDSGRGRGGPPPQMAAVRELMNKPEVQAMIASQQKAAIEARYGQLIKNLNLSPDQANKLTTLLGERQASGRDVYEAARAQGIDPRENPEAFRKLMTDARNEVENSIKSVLGDSGYAQLQNYEQTMPQRGVVNELQQRLTYSNNPLTAAQAEQLVQILATNAPPRPTPQPGAAPGGPPPDGPGRGGFVIRSSDFGMVNTFIGGGPGGPVGAGGPGGPGMGMIGAVLDSRPLPAPITPSAVVQAQSVLTQPQVAVLQQLQQQQAAQQQLANLVRETLTTHQPPAGASASGSSGSTSGAAPGAPPSRRSRPPGGGN